MRPAESEVRELYETQRLTTRQIGAIKSVSKTEVRRWLIHYGIPRRAVSRGLLNRGIQEPTPKELHQMIHIEHLSYPQVAERFGVDSTAVPHWLRKHGIVRPQIWDTRRKGVHPILPTQEEFVALYESGLSLREIADRFSVSRMPIRDRCRQWGIELRPDGWKGGQRITCQDGHQVRSVYEQRVDDWLFENGVSHLYEPSLPCDRRYHSDFLANGWYVEVWGVTQNRPYQDRKERKRRLYADHSLPLIEIEAHCFDGQRKGLWLRRLKKCLIPPTPSLPLLL